MKRFVMTSDRFHFWTPLVLIPILVAQVFVVHVVLQKAPPVTSSIFTGAFALVMVVLLVTTLLTPTAVRLGLSALEVERLFWPSFRVPYAELTGVEEGPVSKVFASEVGRVAGVGGWFWSGGLFRANGVGLVRAWLRRLGPTVVVRRASGLPLLFGVDDPVGLREALVTRIR